MENITDVEACTLTQLLEDAVGKYGDKVFIKFVRDGGIIEKTYEDIRRDSYAVCRFIRSISTQRLHIAVMGKTDYEYIIALTGALLSGNTVIPLAPDLTAGEAVRLLQHSDADLLFCDSGLETLADSCPNIKDCLRLGDSAAFAEICDKYSENGEFAGLSDFETDPDECALIMYTSGTTGEKKGVMLSMRALISNTNFKEISFSSKDVTLSVLPMHHIFCFSSDYLKNIKDGVTVCLNGDVANIGENLLRFEPSMIRLVPVMIASLLRKTRIVKAKNPDFTPRQAAEAVFGRRMRWITSSGAYLSPEITEEFEQMGITIRQAYGMTESGPRISVPDNFTSPESVGRIVSFCNVRIRGGEIQVSSPSLMMGYYKNPQATAEIMTEDGWLRTGDIGRVSESRELYITGRLKNLIILSNGENVSPEEIEKKFVDEPLVKEILVYEKNDRIAADIYPDYAYAEGAGINDIHAAVSGAVRRVNASDVAAKEIDVFNIRTEPLDRTSSGKLKRTGI